MGVQGLTSYVEGNRHFFQDVKFRDSRLVIDGCSLYFRLYFNHGLDQQHGGDYDAFSSLLSQFLHTLAACHIQPYVVLDGGMDPSDKKFSTLRQRLQSKIKEAESLCHGRHGSILPLLTRDVFVQVLTQSGVPLVQCPAEADWEIACLARQWGCPVLSNDSDFYIFNLPGGYLPFRFFQWTSLSGKAPHQHIPVRLYNTGALCRLFGGMNQELLPLCAVLAGNDYTAPRGTESLLALVEASVHQGGGGRGGRSNGAQSRVERVLLWLSSFRGPGEALREVGSLMGEAEGGRGGGGGGRGRRGEASPSLSAQLRDAMREYDVTPQSSLAAWFSGDGGGLLGPPPPLPEELSWAAARALLPPLVLDVLAMRRTLLIPQVENIRLASGHGSARPIRQAVYGLLLHPGGRGGPQRTEEGPGEANVTGRGSGRGRGAKGRGRGGCQGRGGHHDGRGSPAQQAQTPGQVCTQTAAVQTVEEYDRLDLQLKRNQVEARPPRTPVRLDTLGQAPLAARLGVLLDVLGVKEAVLAPLPPHLQLAAAVTGFWLREASPRPSQPQLQALLLGMVYGDLSCCSTQPGPGAAHQHNGPQRKSVPEQSLQWSGLDRLRVRPGERRGLDVGVAHCLSQWQACLWSVLCLNQLLLAPLPAPQLSWLFSGSLVHGLYRSLKGGRPADSLLPSGPSGQLYHSLMDTVRNCSSKNTQQQQQQQQAGSGRKRRGGGGGRGRRGRGGRGGRGGGGGGKDGGDEQLNNRFALLMSEEEFEEELEEEE